MPTLVKSPPRLRAQTPPDRCFSRRPARAHSGAEQGSFKIFGRISIQHGPKNPYGQELDSDLAEVRGTRPQDWQGALCSRSRSPSSSPKAISRRTSAFGLGWRSVFPAPARLSTPWNAYNAMRLTAGPLSLSAVRKSAVICTEPTTPQKPPAAPEPGQRVFSRSDGFMPTTYPWRFQKSAHSLRRKWPSPGPPSGSSGRPHARC